MGYMLYAPFATQKHTIPSRRLSNDMSSQLFAATFEELMPLDIKKNYCLDPRNLQQDPLNGPLKLSI